MEGIWAVCQGERHIGELRAQVVRVVESQAQIATLALVDSVDEQYVLEQLLDQHKPPPPVGADQYHYLMWTPFRYPPLPYGSRFGQRAEPGIFYASLTLETALAECAYYRFVFMAGMAEALPQGRITTEHSTFEARVQTAQGVALERPPFDRYRTQISDPTRYSTAQALGQALRKAGVAACTYVSARDALGVNIAVFALPAIANSQPEALRQWIGVTTADEASFTLVHSNNPPRCFSKDLFLREQNLPIPVC
ncbi:MAG: RES family NAD+ phosphorylase [Pseudomonadota bacterium]